MALGVRESRPPSERTFIRWLEPYRRVIQRAQNAKTWEEVVGVVAALIGMLLLLPGVGFAVMHLLKVDTLLSVLLALGLTVLPMILLGILGDLVRHRAVGLVVAAVLVGFVLCFLYYPALANQLSPKEVFESFEKLHSPGEPLALLGVGSRTTAYYAGGQPQTLTDTTSAFSWLMGGEGHRRFIATRAEDLPKLNQLYGWGSPTRPALEPPGGRRPLEPDPPRLIHASRRPANENPLDPMVLTEMPVPTRKIGANMEDDKNEVLEVIGVDVTDMKGALVEAVAPGKDYHVKTYYRVIAKLSREWEAFIHIDGYNRRHNGDHKPMNGKYPMSLWLPGDLLVDDYKLSLEPNFSPGSYTIFFGLFVGEKRLKVKSGPADGDNRINGGILKVL